MEDLSDGGPEGLIEDLAGGAAVVDGEVAAPIVAAGDHPAAEIQNDADVEAVSTNVQPPTAPAPNPKSAYEAEHVVHVQVVPPVRVLAALAEAVYDVRQDLPPPDLVPVGWDCVKMRAMGWSEWNFTAAAFHSVTLTYPCVVIAFRGTCTSLDLVSDIHVALGRRPQTVNFALAFISAVQEEYADPATSVILTGHSLGALLAEVCAAECGLKAITFESPGCLPILRERVEYHLAESESQHPDITTFLTRPNVVNTCNAHAGTVYRVHISHTKWTLGLSHVVKCLLGTAVRVLTFAWPATLLYRVWNTRTVAEAASVAAQEALGVAHSSRERLHGARKAVKTRWLLASAGLFKLRRNVEIAKEEERLAHAVAASSAEAARLAMRDAQHALHAAYHARSWLTLLPVYMSYRSGASFVGHTIDDIFRTRRGGQHSMEMIRVALDDPHVRIQRMDSWPTLADAYLWNWVVAELRGLLPFRPYNRGLHTLWREEEVVEAQIAMVPGYRVSSEYSSSSDPVLEKLIRGTSARPQAAALTG